MRRLLPWLLLALLAAALYLVFRDGEEGLGSGTGEPPAAEQAPKSRPDPAAALAAQEPPSRSGADHALVVRVVDGSGKPVDATLHLVQDGEPVRILASRGSAQILPVPQELSVVAEAGGSWSEAAHWSAADPGSRDLLLTLGAEQGAALELSVSIDGDGPGAGAQVRVVEMLPEDPWRRMLSGIEFRTPEGSERAAAEPAPAAEAAAAPSPAGAAEPTPAAAPQQRPDAQRIARRSLARETWTADAEGAVSIQGLRAGVWAFEARAEGCSPEYFEVALAESEQAERAVLLLRSGSVAGRVLGPGNAGLAGAEVGLWPKLEGELPWFDPLEDFLRYGRLPSSIPPELRATCDADGRFEILSARAGDYVVLGTADGVRPATSADLKLEPRGRADAGEIKLSRGHEIAVGVSDQVGAAIAGATLSWRAGGTVMGMMTAGSEPLLTGDDGSAALQGLPSGEVIVTVEHGSYAREKRTFQLLAGTESLPKSWEVRLRAGASLSGSVLSAGAPVAGASLRLLPPREESELLSAIFDGEASAFSDADGAFRFERLPPGPWRLGVEHDDHARTMTEAFELHEGENAPRVIQLAAGGAVVVTVLDDSGAPVEGAVVLAQETTDFQSETGTTDARGVTVIEHLPVGSWRLMRVDQLQNSNPQDLRLDMSFVYVDLEEGEREEVQLGGPVQRADVRGTVTMGGQPVSKHTVVLVGNGGVRTERTDEQGEYELAGVPLASYMVTVTATLGGGSSWSGALEVRAPGEMRHDIELPSSIIEVRVVDAGTGQPVAGVPVNLRPEDASSVSGGAFLSSGPDGVASFGMLMPGSYLAAVGNLAMPLLGGGEGLGSTMVEGIVVASANSGTQRVEARLPQPAQLRVRIAGPDGSFVAGAHVHCLSAAGQSINFFSMKGSNGKGVIELSGLPPGPQRFLARHPQIGSMEFEVMLTAGQLVKHEVTLEGGVQLRVSVVDADGAPLTGVLAVAIDSAGKPLFYFTTDESQEVNQAWFSGSPQRVGPLAPGQYVIRLHRPGYQSVDHRVTVAAAPAVQDLRLRFASE